MSRAGAVALLCAFKKHRNSATVKVLARESLIEESSVREWLYAMQAAGIAKPDGTYDTVRVNSRGATRKVTRWKLSLIEQLENPT